MFYNQIRYFTGKGECPKEGICMYRQGVFEDLINCDGQSDGERQNYSVSEILERRSFEPFHQAIAKFQ